MSLSLHYFTSSVHARTADHHSISNQLRSPFLSKMTAMQCRSWRGKWLSMNCWSLSFRLLTGSISPACRWIPFMSCKRVGTTRCSVRVWSADTRREAAPVPWSHHEEALRLCPGVPCGESDRLIHLLHWLSCWKTTTVTVVLLHAMSPFPRYYGAHATRYRGNYRGYRKNTAVTITVSLSTYKQETFRVSCVQAPQ